MSWWNINLYMMTSPSFPLSKTCCFLQIVLGHLSYSYVIDVIVSCLRVPTNHLTMKQVLPIDWKLLWRIWCTPPKSNMPLKIGHSKKKLVFQPSIFRCKLWVSGRVSLKPPEVDVSHSFKTTVLFHGSVKWLYMFSMFFWSQVTHLKDEKTYPKKVQNCFFCTQEVL